VNASREGLAAPDASALRQACLAPYLYTRLQPGQPLRAELRPDYLAALARHQDIKRELVPLVAAWRAAGIEALLFKGFYLSEFIYPVPGARFHGDVDVLIRAEHGDQALRLARALGWLERWRGPRSIGAADGAALFDLYRPNGSTQLDVHQLIVRAARCWTKRPRWITEAVWANSELRAWEGTAVRVPSPADALLVNLVLERAVGDGWRGLKPHDRIDTALLIARGRVQRQELRERAHELGCWRTASAFIEQFGLLSEEAAIRRPSRLTTVCGKLGGFWECGFVPPQSVLRALRAPRLTWDVLRVLPLLLGVQRALRGHRDVRAVLRRLTPAALPNRSSRYVRWRTVRAIHWACKLLPLGRAASRCLPRALAIYAALRARGWPVVFVSGVERDASGLHGHAWVEEHGAVLLELAGYEGKPDYRANFRYPPSS